MISIENFLKEVVFTGSGVGMFDALLQARLFVNIV